MLLLLLLPCPAPPAPQDLFRRLTFLRGLQAAAAAEQRPALLRGAGAPAGGLVAGQHPLDGCSLKSKGGRVAGAAVGSSSVGCSGGDPLAASCS